MRATSVLRFIVFGAVGFGIGWAVAGASVLIARTEEAFFWVPFLSGAFGGAALGLALRGWKKVLALALAGALGFGVGDYFFIMLAVLFGLHPVGVAMGMGLFGGILLGLTFGDWRRVALLGLAAMVGFGVGGAIATALRMPMLAGLTFEWEQPPLLVLYVLVQGMVGLIGGALLGAALGYLERRKLAQGQRPRVR
jgi:hypothetical protein